MWLCALVFKRIEELERKQNEILDALSEPTKKEMPDQRGLFDIATILRNTHDTLKEILEAIKESGEHTRSKQLAEQKKYLEEGNKAAKDDTYKCDKCGVLHKTYETCATEDLS